MKSGTPQPRNRSTISAPISIVVVDDHRFMRELISAMLARQEGRYNVIAERGDAATAMQACQELEPDLLILDINLPDVSGIEAVPQIRKLAPRTRILLCTAFVTDDRVVEALRSGAHGFVEKTNSWADFIEAVRRVSGGEQFFRSQSSLALRESPATGPRSAHQLPAIPLSPREKEVLTLIAHGESSKEIAAKLHIGVGTVDTHRARLLSKLKVRNVAGLVGYAFRSGLLKASALITGLSVGIVPLVEGVGV
ncbi:MAG TPA: response regulator transcription factor [Chthoniobacterales bacterium]|nr:response regulator transcription factor [Chthoniobacterales bacterium]